MSDAPIVIDELTSRTQSQLGQLVLCRGCCCGQTQRAFPETPVERIKQIWKAEKLNQSIQLTISGCLGPCDAPNVVLVLTSRGFEWFANVSGDATYDTFIEWARACHSLQTLLPLPPVLDAHRLVRFKNRGSTCSQDTANQSISAE